MLTREEIAALRKAGQEWADGTLPGVSYHGICRRAVNRLLDLDTASRLATIPTEDSIMAAGEITIMEAQALLDKVTERLGEGGSVSIKTNVRTSDGTRILVQWTRDGFDGTRAAHGYNLVECFRKVLHYEDEVDESLGLIVVADPS